MKIKLTNGGFAIVDADDLGLIKKFRWYAIRLENLSYAATGLKLANGKQTVLLMHRLILDSLSGGIVDHVNGNGLDNRRSNLRFCTHSQNMANRKMHKNNR
jgi:hypothetical protein